jgi:ABC-type amino acid transport substrate-binding protein
MTGDEQFKQFALSKSFTDEELAYIGGLRGKVPIVLGTDTYPVSFYNRNDDDFQGIAKDVLREISKLTGIEFETINNKDTSWGDLLEMLKTGEAALISDLIINEERKEFFIWPETPFFSTSYVFISKSEFPNLQLYQVAQASVGVVEWCATRTLYDRWFPNNSNTILYDSQDEALDALEAGEVDLFFNLGYILYYQRNLREKPGFKANYIFPVNNDIFFGLNINEKELSSIIDKAIPHIDTEMISYEWTSRTFDYEKLMAQDRAYYMTLFSAA